MEDRKRRWSPAPAAASAGRLQSPWREMVGSWSLITSASVKPPARPWSRLWRRVDREFCVQADIARPADRERLLEAATTAFGRLDLLVNNAGMAPRQRVDLLEVVETSYDEVMAANLKGPFFLTQQVARRMLEQVKAGGELSAEDHQHRLDQRVHQQFNRAEYCLSKAGVGMLTALFADRLAEAGINVYEIRPGIIQTDMTRPVQAHYDRLIGAGVTPIKRWGQPEDVARAVLAIAEDLLPVLDRRGDQRGWGFPPATIVKGQPINYHRIGFLKTARDFQAYLDQGQINLGFDPVLESSPSPLGQPLRLPNGFRIGNRFCVLPMEGWDGTSDGRPSELTLRRWRRFGLSGAKLVWGGEAAAVRPDGRANPNQLLVNEANLSSLAALRQELVQAHVETASPAGLYIGLQLTHSGRFSKPNDKKRLEPVILYHHPLLDRKFSLPPDYPVLSDGEIRRLVEDFVRAASLAQKAGFDFVDVKHCHGYLGHEFLSAVDRSGDYGGSFENRTRFLREIVQGIRAYVPGLEIGVRLSAVDSVPFKPGKDGVGKPEPFEGPAYRYAFGGDGTGVGFDLAEPIRFYAPAGRIENPPGVHHGRQPLLQPAHPAAGFFSTFGWL